MEFKNREWDGWFHGKPQCLPPGWESATLTEGTERCVTIIGWTINDKVIGVWPYVHLIATPLLITVTMSSFVYALLAVLLSAFILYVLARLRKNGIYPPGSQRPPIRRSHTSSADHADMEVFRKAFASVWYA